MVKFKPALLFILFSAITFMAAAQTGYTVKFKINGLKDTTCLVAYYYSSGTYIRDTLKVDGSGRCVFKAPADLPKGLYVLAITDKIYFDFVVNNDYKFSMETTKADPANRMVIKDSPENELFYKYLGYNREKYNQIQEIEKAAKNAGNQKRQFENLRG